MATQAPRSRHCRHCMGDCPGDCLLSGGQCIHGWNEKPPRRFYWRLVVTRRWWGRVMWGRDAQLQVLLAGKISGLTVKCGTSSVSGIHQVNVEVPTCHEEVLSSLRQFL